MNVANFFTVLRMLLTVPIVISLGLGLHTVSFALFVFAIFTDYLDGFFARRYNQVTDFGKVFDQVADKILITSVAIAMLGAIPLWYVLVVFIRDSIVNGFRILVASRGVVVPAKFSGKLKTVSQMLVIVSAYLSELSILDSLVVVVLVVLSAIVTVLSGVIYTYQFAKSVRAEG